MMLERASQLVAADRVLEAIPIYEELLRASPANTTLLMNLGVARFKAGQYEEVIRLCRKVLDAQPDLVPAWLFLGASHFQMGRAAEAVEPLTRVVVAQPGERNARLMLGEALLLLGSFEEAAAHLQRASELLPDNPRIWYGLERSYSSLAARFEAEVESRAAASPYWHALAGDAAFRSRRFGLALRHYREALLQSGPSGVRARIAAVYRAAGHPEWAAAEEERDRGEPLDCEVQPALCAFRERQYLEAIRNAGSNSSEAAYWKARAYRELASQASSRLTALPPSPQLHELSARQLDESARHREAVREWRKALQLSPDNPVLKKGLAVSLLHGRDHAAALSLIEELLRHEPDSAELHLLYGRALLESEKPETAAVHLRQALKRAPPSPALNGALGEALLKSGQAEKAIPHLIAALPADEDGARHFQLARAYQLTGQADAAREALRQYQSLQQAAEATRKELEREYPILAP